MGDYAIRVENLGKQYTIGQYKGRYKSLRETLTTTFTAPIQRLVNRKGDNDSKPESTIWALRGVSFDVQHGEVVGIIGRNGAGKSTLLKILGRITEPTEGEVRLRGRVGSLLEVGTGFHPELTGRENIFLNGTILGMSRLEIQRKFDEILDFAEIEKFIDTPAKHYSSGMYMRLAFAVAAHLEPEILLVDEVLAVGDAEFQKKCLGKMGDVAKEGRTVLFVSHNMVAIENLCQRTIYLDEGNVKKDGSTQQVLHEYLSVVLRAEASIDLNNHQNRSGTGQAKIIKVEFLDDHGQLCSSVKMGHSFTIRLKVRSNEGRKRITLGMYIHTEDEIFVADFRTNHMGFDTGLITEDATNFDLVFDPVLLVPRTYVISPWIMDPYVKEDFDWVKNAATFTVESSDFLGTGAQLTSEYGITYISSHWKRV